MKINVIYEDDDVIVVDKLAGVSVHASDNEPIANTVVGQFIDKIKDSDESRPGVVHRLDKNTSGVMILAKNEAAKAFLQQQFKRREVNKAYIAVVEGRLKQPEAIINVPIARHTKNPLRRAVRAGGKPAQTRYQVLDHNNGYSLLKLYPKTGRTHQIRVHLGYIGHPVVGDKLYGAKNSSASRQFLHASELDIMLPSKEKKAFKSQLPSDLAHYLKSLELQMPRR